MGRNGLFSMNANVRPEKGIVDSTRNAANAMINAKVFGTTYN